MISRRLKFALFAVGLGLLYNDWLLGPLVNPRMSLRYSMISELSAQLQPYAWLFHAIDISTGIITLLILPRLWRFLHTLHTPWRQILFATIACIGADSIIDALLPIACAPSMDATCNLAQAHSLLTDAHMIESTIVGTVLFIAPLLWWRVYRTKRALLAQASFWFAILQLAVGASILLTRGVHHDAVVGAFQRVYQMGIGTWVAYVLWIAAAPQYADSPEPSPVQELALPED